MKIEVANLSFGISTLAAGRTLLDRSVDAMLQAGIVPVVSVGNAGPATLTNSSPGSSRSAVTVGGSSRAANERILNEVLYGTEIPDEYYPGIGGDIRPFAEPKLHGSVREVLMLTAGWIRTSSRAVWATSDKATAPTRSWMHALSASPSRVDRRSALQLLRASLLCWLKPFQERLQLRFEMRSLRAGERIRSRASLMRSIVAVVCPMLMPHFCYSSREPFRRCLAFCQAAVRPCKGQYRKKHRPECRVRFVLQDTDGTATR